MLTMLWKEVILLNFREAEPESRNKIMEKEFKFELIPDKKE